MSATRFAFVNLQVGRMTGVAKSIAGQVAAAHHLGLPLDYWVVGNAAEGVHEGVRTRPIEQWPFRRIGSLFKSRVLSQVRELDEYDGIILRYPGGVDLAPLAFFRQTSRPVITVHHTKEVSELTSGGRSFANIARATLERVNGPRILRRVSAIVGVTDEIRQYELLRSGRLVASRTIANGIDVGSVVQTGMVPFTGGELRVVFIAGSHAPWHGTDRLVRSMREYRGSTRVHLDMIGSTPKSPGTKDELPNVTIEYHGTLTGDRLDERFRSATVAFSSLAMYRNGLSQGCVLKTREYVARGLPLVIGYDDVDLRGEIPWLLRVPNDGSIIDFEKVVDFARHVSMRRDVAQEMRAFAMDALDWKKKVLELYEFSTTSFRKL